MKAPSASLLRLFSPAHISNLAPWTASGCTQRLAQPLLNSQISQTAIKAFSTTSILAARKKGKGGSNVKAKSKTTLIRYYLNHPRLPRPLRFSRNRYLRHWTIHRAWLLYQTKQREERQEILERQYNSMAYACEQLRLIDNTGLTADDRTRLGAPGEGKEVGRLYRIAMMKNGAWDGAPIEYARIQTDTPSRDGWNHAWTR